MSEVATLESPLWAQLGAGFNPINPDAPVVPDEEAHTTEAVVPESVVPPKEESKNELQEIIKTPTARQNFAKLEEAKKQEQELRKQAEARLKEYETKETQWKTESEQRDSKIKELEVRLSQINPEDFTAKEKKYQEQLTQLQQDRANLQGELRIAALHRDPDFVAKYDAPKKVYQDVMQDLAVNSGVTVEDFKKAIGNPYKLQEIRESLEPIHQPRWEAALLQIEQLDLQKKVALQNADKTYEEVVMQRQRQYQEQGEQTLQRNLQLARSIGNEPFEKFEFLKERTDLRDQITQQLTALAGGEGREKYTPENIFREITASIVQRDFLTQQAKTIETKDARIAELEKTLAKRDAFIKERHGSLPNNEVTGSDPAPKVRGDIWNDIVVKRS